MFKFSRKLHRRKGFTLVEMLIVVAIIGILATIAVPKYADLQANARGAKVVADLRTLDTAIVIYSTTYNKFPKLLSNLEGGVTPATEEKAGLISVVPVPTKGSTIIVNGFGYTVSNSEYGLNTTEGRATVTVEGKGVGSAPSGKGGTLYADGFQQTAAVTQP